MLTPEIKSKIRGLWDKFWSGGMSNPLVDIEQMSYLIYMKRLEDLDAISARRVALQKQEHKSIFDGKEDCRWSHWKHYNAERMLEHVQQNVFPFIKELRNGPETLYAQYMKDAIFVIPKASLLQEAVSIIDDINITSQSQDVQGDIYEYLLSELKTSGKNGQFRTPRHIIRMMVELIDPDIGHLICDPACGTAGFLIGAYEHILKKYTSPEMVEIDEDGSYHGLYGDKITELGHWNFLRRESFYGYDFDTTMVRIGLMNMILHGIDRPNIDYADTLSRRFEQKPKYDIVFANPPFAGSIDKSDINDSFTTNTRKTELLFLELFYNLLKIGGRAAVVVPRGVLFSTSKAHVKIRRMILEKSQLEAIISLPNGVFLPYSGVGTGILLFTKGGKTDNVWFYDMKQDGYSLDQKRDFIDGKGDIPDLLNKFKNKEESKNSKLVSLDEIISKDYNLNISQYIYSYEVIERIDIKEVWDELIKLTNQREKHIEKLEMYLNELE